MNTDLQTAATTLAANIAIATKQDAAAAQAFAQQYAADAAEWTADYVAAKAVGGDTSQYSDDLQELVDGGMLEAADSGVNVEAAEEGVLEALLTKFVNDLLAKAL